MNENKGRSRMKTEEKERNKRSVRSGEIYLDKYSKWMYGPHVSKLQATGMMRRVVCYVGTCCCHLLH
jgi:hypothetical protein